MSTREQMKALILDEPVASLDYLTVFGQMDWRNKARTALEAADGPGG